MTTRVTGSITRLQNDDAQLIYRIVGFYEYSNALKHLDRLIRISTPDELKIYDEVINERRELAIPINLSRPLQSPTSTLAEAPAKANDNFVRHGLGWMTGLARVELGSMLAGFTEVPLPFRKMSPTEFDASQYHELLLDGARTHYWALSRDPRLRWAMKQRVTEAYKTILSYSRRLVIARGMLRSARALSGAKYSPLQNQELQNWKKAMDDVQAVLIIKVQSTLGAKFFSQTGQRDSEYTRACGALLGAERRELAAGTARVDSLRQ